MPKPALHHPARSLSLWGAAVLLFVVAAPSTAVPIDITYNLQIQVSIPAYGVFPAFAGGGTQTIRFANGTTFGHVSPGPLQILTGNHSIGGSFFIGSHFFSGTQMFINLGVGAGSATAGGAFNLTTNNHVTQGFIHCTGPMCGSFGFVASVPLQLTSQFQTFFQVGNIVGFPSVGPQSFTASGTAGTFGGATLTVQITGQEVSRSAVPEPGTGLLLGLGLAGFAAAGAGWRRRR